MRRVGLGRAIVLCAAMELVVGACGSSNTGVSSSISVIPPVTVTSTAVSEPPATAALPPPTTVPARSVPDKALVVIEENHTQSSALNGMPYLASLADTFGQTTAYQAVAHPSLPNYLAIIGGSTFGVTDDQPPKDHPVAGQSVFDLAIAASTTAKAYLEDMPGPCTLSSSGDYAVKHNPWAYFADQVPRRNCQDFDMPAGTTTGGALHDDIQAGTLPTIGILIPNLCHDAHNCPLTVADDWLRQWLPVLMEGPDYRTGHLAIVITFDEDDNTAGNTVLTTVIAPTVQHVISATPLTHYSLTRYLAEISTISPPGEAAAAPSLRSAFGY